MNEVLCSACQEVVDVLRDDGTDGTCLDCGRCRECCEANPGPQCDYMIPVDEVEIVYAPV